MNKHESSSAKCRKVLMVSLIGIVILGGGSLVLDCMHYHTTSTFLKFLENQPPQLKTDSQTIESVRETQERIRNRIGIDTPIILLALLGLWCMPRALNGAKANPNKNL